MIMVQNLKFTDIFGIESKTSDSVSLHEFQQTPHRSEVTLMFTEQCLHAAVGPELHGCAQAPHGNGVNSKTI